jgi:predicted phosphoribosyltransferase
MTAPKPTAAEALYPSRAAAGALLGRQLYQRCPAPAILLGITPTGVEIAANAAQAMNCQFDVIVGAHVRLEGKGMVGAIAEDADAITDPDFNPGFDLMDQLHAAMDSARRAVKTERLLFRGQRPLRSLEELNVVVVDGHITSPWKALAAATAAEQLGARKVWIAAAACTQAVQERIRARKFDLVCPSVVLDPAGHPRPFGDPQDPSAERLRSIVVARQAA